MNESIKNTASIETTQTMLPEETKASNGTTNQVSIDQNVVVIDQFLMGNNILCDYFPMLGMMYCQIRGIFMCTVSLVLKIFGSVPKYFTFANIAKFLFLYWWFCSPMSNKQGVNNNDASSIRRLHPKQHFLFGSFGFFQASLEVQDSQILNAENIEKRASAKGYYAFDIAALDHALREYPEFQGISMPGKTNPNSTVINANGTKMAVDPSPSQECQNVGMTSIVLKLNLGVDPRNEIQFIRDSVTFLIGYAQSRPDLSLEVVVMLESAGGNMHSYGLIAEQLKRLRTETSDRIILTVTCDMVAASGGYLIASTASPGHLLASRFALIGSIGVVVKTAVNVQEALEQYGIKAIQFKSGDRKRHDGSIFGKISETDLQYMQEKLDRSHAAFGNHVKEWRGDKISDYDLVLSGDDWLGKDALELGLVDRIITSDEYLNEKVNKGDRVIMLAKNIPTNDKGFWFKILDVLLDVPKMDDQGRLDVDIRVQSFLSAAKMAVEQFGF